MRIINIARIALLVAVSLASIESFGFNHAARAAMRNTMHHHRMNNLRHKSNYSSQERKASQESDVRNYRKIEEAYEPNLEAARKAHDYFKGKIGIVVYYNGPYKTMLPPIGMYTMWESSVVGVTPGWLVISKWIKERPDYPRWAVIYKDGAVYEYSYVGS